MKSTTSKSSNFSSLSSTVSTSGNEIECPHCHQSFDYSEALRVKQEQWKREHEKEIGLERQKAIDAVRAEIVEQAKKTAAAENLQKMSLLEQQIANYKLQASQVAEQKKIEKEKLLLEQQSQRIELEKEFQRRETERKLNHEVELREKENTIEQMKKALDQAKNYSAKTSQQGKGQAFEDVFEDFLKSKFKFDTIVRSKAGQSGADFFQTVKTAQNKELGSILWETKNTLKYEGEKWLKKLRNDMRDKNATIGVLVSKTLPPDTEHVRVIDGVFVIRNDYAQEVSEIIRHLVETMYANSASQGLQASRVNEIYRYLTGPRFKHALQEYTSYVDAGLKSIERERISSEKNFKAREKLFEDMKLLKRRLLVDLNLPGDEDSVDSDELSSVHDGHTVEAEFAIAEDADSVQKIEDVDG